MGKADFHRRWAGRLLRLAAGAKDSAVRDQLRLMAADSLEKAARFERETQESPATPAAGAVGGSDEERQVGEGRADEGSKGEL
jgi:hypothetical protein